MVDLKVRENLLADQKARMASHHLTRSFRQRETDCSEPRESVVLRLHVRQL